MRVCAICEKKSAMAGRLKRLRATKYNPTGKRRQKVNLQWLALSSGKKVLACAKCIKATAKA
jgi:ribosomal protein L28